MGSGAFLAYSILKHVTANFRFCIQETNISRANRKLIYLNREANILYPFHQADK